MEKRLITEKQEEALKLCHHDFGGLIQEEAAKIMGITQQAISELLSNVEKVLPEYFPLLTKQEAKIYHYYTKEGWSVYEIAEYMELTENAVYMTLRGLKDKGEYFPEAIGRVLSWDQFKEDNNGADILVKLKF